MRLIISIRFIKFQSLWFKPILKRKVQSLASYKLARLFCFISLLNTSFIFKVIGKETKKVADKLSKKYLPPPQILDKQKDFERMSGRMTDFLRKTFT